MNLQLLDEIKQYILENPGSFDMDVYHNYCGTVGCIAGWALMRKLGTQHVLETRRELYEKLRGNTNNLDYYHWPLEEAAKLFDITIEQANDLFLTHNWPHNFEHDYEEAEPQSKERAEVTARRIDHFIETGK